MDNTQVLLFVSGGGTKQRFSASAEELSEGSARVFRFAAEGADFRISFADTVVIRRQGSISYALELNTERPTRTEIITEYGCLAAEVRTLRSEIQEKNGFCYRGEYEMMYNGFVQRHKVEFYVRGKGGQKQ